MGWGDELMGSGMARGAAERGKLIAFGNGHHIVWSARAREIFRGNPNVAPPGSENNPALRKRLEWIEHYKGKRVYNRPSNGAWVWNMDFRAQPGELFDDAAERQFAERYAPGFVLIEPNIPAEKAIAPNKQWPVARYIGVARTLYSLGFRVAQFKTDRNAIPVAEQIASPSFRHAVAILRRAALYIGPEGGLHHAAAAAGIPAVVIFGGFIPPQVTGYATHVNIAAGGKACGRHSRCQHCVDAMLAISTERILSEAKGILKCP